MNTYEKSCKRITRNSLVIGWMYLLCGGLGFVAPMTGHALMGIHWVAILIAMGIGIVELYLGKQFMAEKDPVWARRLAWNQIGATLFLIAVLGVMLAVDPVALFEQMDVKQQEEVRIAAQNLHTTLEAFMALMIKISVGITAFIVLITQLLIVWSYRKHAGRLEEVKLPN